MTGRWLACALIASVVGCGDGGEDGADGGIRIGVDANRPRVDSGPLRFDAGPPPAACEGQPPLELGRCRDAAGDPRCDGSEGQEPVFESMSPEGDIPMVRGPQGATMFVMAARTSGIVPGDPTLPYSSDNPLVEIVLTDDEGELLSLYRGRSPFLPDGTVADTFFNAGFFVVVDTSSSSLSGTVLHARATLRDADGQARCGTLSFTAMVP